MGIILGEEKNYTPICLINNFNSNKYNDYEKNR